MILNFLAQKEPRFTEFEKENKKKGLFKFSAADTRRSIGSSIRRCTK